MTRYAIYFAPSAHSLWWQAGCRWLGRDPETGLELTPYRIPGISADLRARLVAQARRYGLHATLKAPFRLLPGCEQADLLSMAQRFAASFQPIRLHDMGVRPLRHALTLRPAQATSEISTLAQACVSHFDALRAPLEPMDWARRRAAGLTARQEELLARWGYPYTEEEYRFHITLTDSLERLDPAAASAVRRAAEECFAAACVTPLVVDNIAVFVQKDPDSLFRLLRRFPLGAEAVAVNRTGASASPQRARAEYIALHAATSLERPA